MPPATTTPRRRRFTISLRVLMLAVLVVGALVGWRANRARTQRRALATIRAAKGLVGFDYQDFPRNTPRAVIQAAKPPGPAWLRRQLGNAYFQEVTSVTLDGPVSAETMAAVGSLDRLESLYLKNAPAIAGGLAPLRGSTRLKRVNITSPVVTDADLAILGQLPDLELIWLVKADITDAGLAHLAGLRKLKNFNLADTPKVTDLGVDNLAPILPSLTGLELTGTGVGDRSMIAVGRLRGLEQLDLARTRVTDEGLARLGGLADLRLFWLGGTAISDRGLASLRGLTKLIQLDLKDTAVTDAGLADLADMTDLGTLDLASTPVTGEGFAHLGRLQKLFFLRLQKSKFSDAGMANLAAFKALQTVFLAGTEVSDAGLVHLQGLPKLDFVSTGSSRVTDAGYAAFRKATPGVKQGSNRPYR